MLQVLHIIFNIVEALLQNVCDVFDVHIDQ